MTRMPPHADPEFLIDLIYEAAFDAAHWPKTLGTIAAAVGGTGALMFTPDVLNPAGEGFQAHNVDLAMMGPYSAYYSDLDITRQVYIELQERAGWRGGVYDVDAIIPREEFTRSPVFNEFFAPGEIGFIAGVCTPAIHDLQLPRVHLSVFRPPGGEGFDAAAMGMLDVLRPHLRRALQLQARLHRDAVTTQGGLAVLDRLPTGVVVLDAANAVLYLNAEAERILAQRDGLAVAGRRLAATTLSDRALQSALAERNGGALAAIRPSGQRDYIVVVAPTGSEGEPVAGARPRKIVFITDLTVRPPARDDLLRQIWGLTAAEARVAMALLDGISPREIAERAAVSEATVRTQMRAVFDKTGTARQAELVRVLSATLGIHG